MRAKSFVVGAMLLAGFMAGCGGAEPDAPLTNPETGEVTEHSLSRCQAGCEARYNFCITRALQPPEVCRDTLFACLEECELTFPGL